MKFEYIAESDMEVVKRGRKSQVPAELVEAIKGMPEGMVCKLDELQLDTTDEDYKNAKATLSATIRQAGTLAGREVSINYTPDGIPQVRTKAPKGTKKPKATAKK